MNRYQAIRQILAQAQPQDLVLSTTGMISREVFLADDQPRNFYMLGSRGLLSSLGLGLALLAPQRRIYILEGDGSALMSLGTLPLIATEGPPNLVHIILDNEAYESTGGQPTLSDRVDLAEIGRACGYPHTTRVADIESLHQALLDCLARSGPQLLLVKVGIAPVPGLPRVSHTPEEIRDRFRTAFQR